MSLSQAELGVALEKLGLRMAAHQLAIFMGKIDQDGSGSINLAEFLAATAELSLQQHKAAAVRAFARLDLDGNGLITLEEARVALDVAEGEDAALAEMFAQYDTDKGCTLTFDMFWHMLNPTISLP